METYATVLMAVMATALVLASLALLGSSFVMLFRTMAEEKESRKRIQEAEEKIRRMNGGE